MRHRNRTSSSSAHSANAALNAKITNSSVLADYLRKVSTFQKLSGLGQKLRRPLQRHANLPYARHADARYPSALVQTGGRVDEVVRAGCACLLS